MKYLDFQDKKYSKIGIGTGRFGTIVPEERSKELLDLFFYYGGTVIDTARNYYEWVEDGRGKSEQCIGKWMEERNLRDKVCISTKGGVKNKGKEWFINLSKGALLDELKESLEALRTDYLDIYVLHRDEKERSVEEIINTLQELKEKASICHIGVSNWTYERVYKANEYAIKNGLCPLEMLQTWWSLAEYTDEMWNDSNTTHMDEELYHYMRLNQMVGMAYTSQCKGFFQKAIEFGLENVDDFLKYRILTERNLKKLEYIREFCKENRISPTAVVTGYITSNTLNGIALISTSKQEQLKNIMQNADYSLPERVIKELDMI